MPNMQVSRGRHIVLSFLYTSFFAALGESLRMRYYYHVSEANAVT